MFPIIPAILVAATGTVAAVKYSKRKKEVSEQRKKVFTSAMRSAKDPDMLTKLADTFEKEGHKHEANELRKRAKVLSASPKVKAQRKAIFKQALKSKDPKKVGIIANAFNTQGMYKAAEKLTTYQNGLGAKNKTAVHGEPDFEGEYDGFADDNDEFAFDAATGEFEAEHDNVIETTSEDVEQTEPTDEEAEGAEDFSENNMMREGEA